MTGVPTILTVRVSRKLGDGDYGSFGGEWECTVNLPPNANLEEESQALFAFGKAFLGTELADIQADLRKGVAQDAQQPPVVQREEPKADAKELVPGEEHSEKVVKFTLAKRTDGKYELGLYGDYGGKPSQYPILRHVRERDAMWEMLKPVVEDYDFSSLPVEHACEWLAHYVISERKTPRGHFYKDLVALKGM